jgi:hypothetical protein
LSVLIALLQMDTAIVPGAPPEISVVESLDRAPPAIAATYTFQCGDDAATLVIMVPQARSRSGVKVAGQPNAVAFLNGASVGEARNRQLQEALRSVGILPEVTPSCSGGRPSVSFQWREYSSAWSFIEERDPR